MHQGSHHLPSMHSYLGEQFQMTITLVINPHTLEYTDIPTITMILMCTFVFIYTVYIYIYFFPHLAGTALPSMEAMAQQ